MSAEHMLFLVVLFFIMLFIIATGYAYYSYKKHIQDYTIFFFFFRRNGGYVDSISNVCWDFRFAFAYFLLFKNHVFHSPSKKKKNVCGKREAG